MLERPLLAPLDKGANGCRRSVEDVDAVALYNLPEAVRLWMIRRTLVHQNGRAIRQWPIDDIRMPRHPADVRRAPVNVFILEVEYPLGS